MLCGWFEDKCGVQICYYVIEVDSQESMGVVVVCVVFVDVGIELDDLDFLIFCGVVG